MSAIGKVLICLPLVALLAAGQRRIGLIVSAPDELHGGEIMAEFERETNRILRLPGVELAWRQADRHDSTETFDRLAVVRLVGSCAVVDRPAQGAGWALGLTHVSEGRILPFIEIHCDRVVGVLWPKAGQRSPRIEAGIIGRGLARVAAHEIYHVLANSAEHDATGLSKEALGYNDLFGWDVGLSERSLKAIVRNLDGGRRPAAFTAAAKSR
jgi:hypothetical protein